MKFHLCQPLAASCFPAFYFGKIIFFCSLISLLFIPSDLCEIQNTIQNTNSVQTFYISQTPQSSHNLDRFYLNCECSHLCVRCVVVKFKSFQAVSFGFYGCNPKVQTQIKLSSLWFHSASSFLDCTFVLQLCCL